jgi:hypothetical protein
MASASSIARLHAQGKTANLADLEKPQPEPVKTANFADSEPDLLAMQTAAWQQPARRRFGSSGRIAAPAMMNGITPTVVPEGRSRFEAVSMRESVQQMRAAVTRRIEQQAQRAGAGHHQHGLAIQV